MAKFKDFRFKVIEESKTTTTIRVRMWYIYWLYIVGFAKYIKNNFTYGEKKTRIS